MGAVAKARPGERPRGIGEAQLVAAALEGERWAKDALFRRHGRSTARLGARIMATTQDVDDIVHDAFIRAFEKLEQLQDPEAFKAWVQRIAVSRTRNMLRRRRLERTLGLFHGDGDATLERLASPGTSPEERAALAFIDDLLLRSPANQRIAWVLRVVEGHSVAEVATLCNCSESTAKRRIRAVQRRVAARVKITGARHG